MSNIQKLRRIVFKNLDKIYSVSKEIADRWDKNTIPLKTLKEIINRSKVSANTGNKIVDDHNEKYNKCLTTLYLSCVKTAKRMDSKSVPLSIIKEGIEIIKSAYHDQNNN